MLRAPLIVASVSRRSRLVQWNIVGGHVPVSTRRFGLLSELRKSFNAELEKNEEIKKSLEELKKSGSKLEKIAKSQMEEVSLKSKNAQKSASEATEKVQRVATEAAKKAHEHAAGTTGFVNKFSSEYMKKKMEKTQANFSGALDIAKDVLEQVRDRTEKLASEYSVLQTLRNARDKSRDVSRRVIGDASIRDFRESVNETWSELVHGKTRKDIDETLSRKLGMTTSSKDEGEKKEEGSRESPDKDPVGGRAVMILKDQGTAWDRIGRRLKETPIIQGILFAADQVSKTNAGKKIGAGATAARNKLGDATEDAKEFWETSQNPWIYRLSSVYDGIFGETEMAKAIRELKRADPSFQIEEWKEDIAESVIPVVIESFLKGESRRLERWLGEAAFNTVNHAIRERKSEGLVVDPTILAIRHVEVVAAKAEDKQAPIVIVQFMAQQINCIKNREGEIVEGSEGDVRAVYYALAFQREYNEEEMQLDWKIIEMAMIGEVPWV